MRQVKFSKKYHHSVRGVRFGTAEIFCAVAAAMCCYPPVQACESGTVRDAAVLAKRDIHQLRVFANRDDPQAEAILQDLNAWMDTDAAHLNVELQRVNTDDPDIAWQDYGVPSAPPRIPVVALFGEFEFMNRRFVMGHWEPGPSPEDLATLHTSPLREVIKEQLAEAWALLVFAPATDSDAEPVETMLAAVTRYWADNRGVSVPVLHFDRTDPREHILRSFIGLQTDGPPWLGVVFGRGKLFAPPLEGEEITEDRVNELLDGLALPCTCLQDSSTLGVDIPLTWDPALDAQIATVATPTLTDHVTYEEQVEALAETFDSTDSGVFALMIAAVLGFAAIAMGTAVWRFSRRDRAN